jgi:hypothetical protein
VLPRLLNPELERQPMYHPTTPRRPWRGSGHIGWHPDKMLNPMRPYLNLSQPTNKYPRGKFREIYKTARTKQRRLDRYLCSPFSDEWNLE